ncbi:MAG: DUF302 domain-containing protein [Hyphomicrobiaceae bacterium]|nr:MAG: DUF302 domain-containing protein [Hyphomicrobiaceae bacterium]
MRTSLLSILSLALAIVLSAPLPAAFAEDGAVRVATKKGKFADVRSDLEEAIVNQGLKIDFNGKVGDMLKRTGADVGSTKTIYSSAEYFTFCSAQLSRAAMEADPANISHCPYTIFVYERAEQPGVVYVGYRRPQGQGSDASRKATAAIDKLLEKILTSVAK